MSRAEEVAKIKAYLAKIKPKPAPVKKVAKKA